MEGIRFLILGVRSEARLQAAPAPGLYLGDMQEQENGAKK
jgi:hypothetical protein